MIEDRIYRKILFKELTILLSLDEWGSVPIKNVKKLDDNEYRIYRDRYGYIMYNETGRNEDNVSDKTYKPTNISLKIVKILEELC